MVPRNANQNVVRCKWVYKVKYRSDGNVERYKARLVAQGFHQQESIDYHETFSPVVKLVTIRLFTSLAVSFNWPLRQLDDKNAFLHSNLTEEVYMKQPPEFVHSAFLRHICKLKQAIYSLKHMQTHRAWFHHYSSFLLSHGFMCSHADPSMFISYTDSLILVLLLYVDDIVQTGNSEAML